MLTESVDESLQVTGREGRWWRGNFRQISDPEELTVSLCFSYICYREDRTASFRLLLTHEYAQQGYSPASAISDQQKVSALHLLSSSAAQGFRRVWNSAGSAFLPFLPLPHHTYQTCIMVWRYYLTKHTSPSLDFHSCFSKCVAFLIIAWCLLPGESELSS